MAKMVTVKCANCKSEFEAREADRKRGWGRFCSKSCKAIKQTSRQIIYTKSNHVNHNDDPSWDAHKFY